MKKIGLLIFIAALIAGIVLANTLSTKKSTGEIFKISINRGVTGSGNIVSEKRDLADFSAIDASGIVQVEATAGKDFSVEVEADDNLLALVKTEVSGGVLQLGTEKGISTKNSILVRITAPSIESLEVSGASNVSLDNVSNENLQIDSSGASKVSVAGTAANLIIDASGASKIDAENLHSENVAVDASGASGVKVSAANELKAEASGASNVAYAGNPKNLIKKTSGASSVRQKQL
jgi:hypothetical protein